MMETDIVIGANFGDEGKGLITDFYASKGGAKTLVVRHNSSAQAGHSVTMKDGRRHVFGHIGAGSFSGAATYLSKFYVCSPMLFAKEYRVLEKICQIPTVYVDQRCQVTTPYDLIINQIIEEHRGTQRHGSCGVGFGETIERNLCPDYALTVGDINNLPFFLKRLMAIRHEWLPRRLVALGVKRLGDEWIQRIEADRLIEDYIDAVGYMLRRVHQVKGLPVDRFNRLVFEGAQGLMLDQDHAYFPHVTRSTTGASNACAVLQEAGLNEARVTYVTRSYLTRHGAGPLPHELPHKPYPGIIDLTNVKNTYQEHLRFAWLDVDALMHTIAADKERLPDGMQAEFGLAVSCVDQINGQARYIQGGQLRSCSPDAFVDYLYVLTGSCHGLASYGPTREDVREYRLNDVRNGVRARG